MRDWLPSLAYDRPVTVLMGCIAVLLLGAVSFGGLSVDETAEVLGVSKRTADGDWARARAWLERELAG